MKNKNQIILLTILLVSPVLVFLTLNRFGRNHYEVMVYYPLDSTQVNGKWHTTYHTIPDFTLTNQADRILTRKDLQGKIYVANFFFTRCGNPTLCPRMSEEFARVQEAFKEESNVLLVAHTVDPTYDTPEVLRAYGKKYGAIEGKWHFLTGNKKTIYDLAYYGYKINAGEEKNTVTPEFLHATKFMLIDEQGRVRGYYDGVDREEVDRLVVEIKILLYNLKNQNKSKK
jgi:protein SCO1/2